MSFLLPDREEETDKRSEFVRNLAHQLGAFYYRGDSVLRENFQGHTKSFSYNDATEVKNSNVIKGIIDGYEYCFYEYYHIGMKTSRFVSRAILKLKDKVPDFHLKTKKSAIFDILKSLLIFLFLVVLICLPCLIKYPKLGVFLIVLFFCILSYPLVNITITEFIEIIKKQEKYKIGDDKFKKKYFIISYSAPDEISSFFNEKICHKIIDSSVDLDISVNNNMIIIDLNIDELLSLNSCKKTLNDMLNKAKIFETVSDEQK